jgi:hypothetical protein
MLIASGCSIPTRAVTPDGVLLIEMFSAHSYQLGENHYGVDELLEIAIGRLDMSKVKRIEIYFPRSIAQDPGPLASLYGALNKKNVSARADCYVWTPGHPETATALSSCPLITLEI